MLLVAEAVAVQRNLLIWEIQALIYVRSLLACHFVCRTFTTELDFLRFPSWVILLRSGHRMVERS